MLYSQEAVTSRNILRLRSSLSRIRFVEALSSTSRRFSLCGKHMQWIQLLIQPRQHGGKHSSKFSQKSPDSDTWANCACLSILLMFAVSIGFPRNYTCHLNSTTSVSSFSLFAVSRSWGSNSNSLRKCFSESNETFDKNSELVLATTYII